MTVFSRVVPTKDDLADHRTLIRPSDSPDSNEFHGEVHFELSQVVEIDEIYSQIVIEDCPNIGVRVEDIHPLPVELLPERESPIHPLPNDTSDPTFLSEYGDKGDFEEVSGLCLEISVTPEPSRDEGVVKDEIYVDSKNARRSLKISVPCAESLQILSELTSGPLSESLFNRIEPHYKNTSRSYFLFDILRDARSIVEFPAYVEMVNTIASSDSRFKREWNGNILGFFKNMCLHNKDHYYMVNSKELTHRIDSYNKLFQHGDISEEEVEFRYLAAYRDEDSPSTHPEQFGFRTPSISDQIAEETLEEISKRIRDGGDSIESIREWFLESHDRSGNILSDGVYEDHKQKAQRVHPNQRAKRWRALIDEAVQRGHHEFSFALANFLYWKSLTGVSEDRLMSEMFGASASLFYRHNVRDLQQKANIKQHLAKARVLIEEDAVGEALLEIRHSMSIAENEDGSWDQELWSEYAGARRDYALAKHSRLLEENSYHGALNSIENGTKEIADMRNIAIDHRDTLISHMKGYKHEVMALRAKESGEIERCEIHYEQAHSEFEEAGKASQCERINNELRTLVTTNKGKISDSSSTTSENQGESTGRDNSKQAAFKKFLFDTYGEVCVICGAERKTPDGRPECHAAHIKPVSDGGPYTVKNGLPLCQLHHWGFDNGWLAIDPSETNLTVEVKDAANTPGYSEFAPLDGDKIRRPSHEDEEPGVRFITYHRKENGFEVDDSLLKSDDPTDEEDEENEEEVNEQNESTDIDNTQKSSQDLDKVNSPTGVFRSGEIRGSMNHEVR